MGRRFFVLVFFVALMTFAAGCNAAGDTRLDPDNPVTITIWHYYHGVHQRAFEAMVNDFNNTLGMERGVFVQAFNRGGVNELAEAVVAAAYGRLDAGPMPDIFASYGDTTLRLLNMGHVAAIDDYLTEEEIAEFEGYFITQGRIGRDNLYIFPIAKATELLNVDRGEFDRFKYGLADAGFTETVSLDGFSTWEGIARMADIYYRFTEATEGRGRTFMGIDNTPNFIIVSAKQLGMELVTIVDGEAVIANDREVLRRIWDMYWENTVLGRFGRLGRFSSDDIRTGNLVAYVGSSSSISFFPDSRISPDGTVTDIELTTLFYPVFEGADSVAVLQGAGMVVTRSEPVREYAATLFLRWFTEIERNIPFALNSSYMPVRSEAKTPEILQPFMDEIAAGAADTIAGNVANGLNVAIDQLRQFELYSSPPFVDAAGGFEFRRNLPLILRDAATRDRAEFLEMVGDGMDRDEAFAILYERSHEDFELWLEFFSD